MRLPSRSGMPGDEAVYETRRRCPTPRQVDHRHERHGALARSETTTTPCSPSIRPSAMAAPPPPSRPAPGRSTPHWRPPREPASARPPRRRRGPPPLPAQAGPRPRAPDLRVEGQEAGQDRNRVPLGGAQLVVGPSLPGPLTPGPPPPDIPDAAVGRGDPLLPHDLTAPPAGANVPIAEAEEVGFEAASAPFQPPWLSGGRRGGLWFLPVGTARARRRPAVPDAMRTQRGPGGPAPQRGPYSHA
jgi:hypothetical protein